LAKKELLTERRIREVGLRPPLQVPSRQGAPLEIAQENYSLRVE
jgi:hypothetical protein